MKTMLHTIAMMTLIFAAVAAADHHPEAKEADSASKAPATTGAAKTESQATTNAEAPALKKLAGSYTLVGSQAAATKTIQAAIEKAVSGMGSLEKNVAKKRLDKVNGTVVHLKIHSVQKNVTVGMDDYVVTAPLDGGSTEVTTPTGDKARASFKLDNASLVQDLVQHEGARENTFRFNSQGQLVMLVKETSPKLTAPVTYTLVYKRAGK